MGRLLFDEALWGQSLDPQAASALAKKTLSLAVGDATKLHRLSICHWASEVSMSE